MTLQSEDISSSEDAYACGSPVTLLPWGRPTLGLAHTHLLMNKWQGLGRWRQGTGLLGQACPGKSLTGVWVLGSSTTLSVILKDQTHNSRFGRLQSRLLPGAV